MVLPVISKCGTLDECVLVLMRGESLVVIRQVGQHLVCGSQGVRRFVLEDVLGDVRDEEMTIDRPRIAKCGQKA